MRSLMGQKKLAVLTRVFYKRIYGGFCQAARQKVAVITRWPYYQGGRKAGFHCMIISMITKKSWTRYSFYPFTLKAGYKYTVLHYTYEL